MFNTIPTPFLKHTQPKGGHTYSWPNVPGPKRQTVGWMPHCPATKASTKKNRNKIHLNVFWAGKWDDYLLPFILKWDDPIKMG